MLFGEEDYFKLFSNWHYVGEGGYSNLFYILIHFFFFFKFNILIHLNSYSCHRVRSLVGE